MWNVWDNLMVIYIYHPRVPPTLPRLSCQDHLNGVIFWGKPCWENNVLTVS